MSDKTIAAQGYRLRRAEADAKGAKRWKRRALEAEAQVLSLRARAEKAEAERDEFKQIHRHALDSVDQVFQACDEVPHPLLPDFCRVGEDKFRAVIRLANSYISERDRAEKYLAAMERALGLFEQGRTIMAVGVIRTIVEEARRG